MAPVRYARTLAAIAGAAGALLLLMSPVSAHAAGFGSGIFNLTPVVSQDGIPDDLKWNPGNDTWKWSDGDDGNDNDGHGKPKDSKSVPEPGTLGLYLSALLGGVLFLRARKSRSR